ncbi:MAG: hypothetical protein A2V73_06930 [candidate division Zixibacteria bacterium RBG_19FT_COMBO_42_43]|nr:MAG: hypothetical protein A2V73_06930 [candidate division Zixibacteria bacterium RBG_19FT_COMBO_42_43]
MPFPNNEQLKIINHRGRPLVVIAGPGTGKTRTLVERMIGLLRENLNRKVSFITFTRTSRRDTSKKIENAIGSTAYQEIESNSPASSTLHMYAKSLVHHYSYLIGRPSNFSVLIEDKGEKSLVLEDLSTDLDINISILLLGKALSCVRATNNWPTDFPLTIEERDEISRYYNSLLIFYNTYDMEGLVDAACKILSDPSTIVPVIFLQVDEYQDLNPNDQNLVNLTASHSSSHIVVVGDDAQSIYGFRNANYQGIREIWQSHAWDKISLTESHRLPIHIQRAAQALIANEGYLGCNLQNLPDNGKKLLTLQCTTDKLQIKAVAKKITELKAGSRNQKGEALLYNDFMVLCPTKGFVKTMAKNLENEFSIPTKLHDKASIPDDHWRLLLVLRMLNYEDNLALRQWLSISGLKKVEITKIRQDAMQSGKSLFRHCATLSDSRICEILNAIEELKDSKQDFEKFRVSLKNFPNLLIEDDLFPKVGLTIDEVTREPRAIGSVIRSIYEKFGLIESESEFTEEDKVLVTTLHSAKGLEAEYVFVTRLNFLYVPMANRDIKEERRVLYVALTRARQDVFLTFYEYYDEVKKRRLYEEAMSPFLHDIRDHLEINKVKAEDMKVKTLKK